MFEINKKLESKLLNIQTEKEKLEQELQEVLKFPIEIFWNLEARNLK